MTDLRRGVDPPDETPLEKANRVLRSHGLRLEIADDIQLSYYLETIDPASRT